MSSFFFTKVVSSRLLVNETYFSFQLLQKRPTFFFTLHQRNAGTQRVKRCNVETYGNV